MTRVGWVILLLILAAAATFAALLRGGGVLIQPRASVAPSRAVPADADGLPLPSGPISLIIPVAGIQRTQLTDTWGEARGEGRSHHGTDIPAPQGTAVVAAAAGTIEKLYQDQRGGTTIYERSPDRRWTFYYAHLSGYAPGLHEGQRVAAGQLIGQVGDTGDAGAGNFHLHFGLTRTDPGQHWYQGDDTDAFPYLGTGQALP